VGALTGKPFPSSAAGALGDVADALRFFTRLPLPAAPPAPLDFNRVAWAAPVAGALLGAVGAAALGLTQLLGLPALVSAALVTASLVAASGALHEDGLADVWDGFGGGQTRARKLELMRDSRIGAYGATALTLALILRAGALAGALSHGAWIAAAALIIVSALSRAGALMPLTMLNAARGDGAGVAAGRLEPTSFAAACASAIILALLVGLFSVGAGRAICAALAGALGAGTMTAIAARQIGGQTGDVAGAAQQWAEVAAWCGLLMGRFAA